MQTEEAIINRVAQSGIVTIDLADFYEKGERVVFDVASTLYQGLILREKEFRQFLKEHPWQTWYPDTKPQSLQPLSVPKNARK